MPLKGVPDIIHADFLYQLARMGHGDYLVIADSNFPSDATAAHCVQKTVIRAHGTTADILADILQLMPLDQYVPLPIKVMDRVPADKERDLKVPAYEAISIAAWGKDHASYKDKQLDYVERFEFYEKAKGAFFVIQSDDNSLYANLIVSKGVI